MKTSTKDVLAQDIIDGLRKRIAELEAELETAKSAYSDLLINSVQEVRAFEATIKAIRELEPIFADTAVNITERVYRADELEALLPEKE